MLKVTWSVIKYNKGVLMKLSPTKIKILILLAKGYSDKEISQHLQMSARTVQTHINTIIARLNARNRTNAVALFMQANPKKIIL
jgi:DNA-binding NarL/FixJ family response regulator